MEQYHDLLKHVLQNGTDKGDRTGTGTRSIFGYQMRFDLQMGFPLVTTKKVSFKWICNELIWFLQGCPDGIQGLKDRYKITIWDEWLPLENEGKIVPYGNMWRAWKNSGGETIDQLKWLINEIRTNPNSRRLILETWNVGEMDNFVLPPCHKTAQFNVTEGRLSCLLSQRSWDIFLGAPYNIAQYALLTHVLANICDLQVGDLVISAGDVHIYANHFEQVKLQLSRTPFALPTLKINRKLGNDISAIDSLTFADFTLNNYVAHPSIKGEVSV